MMAQDASFAVHNFSPVFLDEIGLLDEELGSYIEDVDLAWRARLAGYTCAYAPAAIVYHMVSATGGGPIASYFVGRNLIFVLAKSRSSHLLRWVTVGSLAYPLVAYLYVRLLFKLFIVETPWLFIALMILVVVFIGSVFFLALRSGSSRNAPWLVLFGAASILVSQTIAGRVIAAFLGFLQPPLGIMRSFSWSIPLKFAAMDAIYGLFFGLLLGLIMGFQNKMDSPKLAA